MSPLQQSRGRSLLLRAVTPGPCWTKALVLLGLHISLVCFPANGTPSPLAAAATPSLKITAGLWATKGRQEAFRSLSEYTGCSQTAEKQEKSCALEKSHLPIVTVGRSDRASHQWSEKVEGRDGMAGARLLLLRCNWVSA